MRIQDWARLLSLAAIWGFSFIFMRVIAPVMGALWTAEVRILLAGIALMLWCCAIGFDMQIRQWWSRYLVIGLLNSGIPFALYAFAALHIPAGYSAIVNAGTPIFGALFAALWLSDKLTPRKILGLLLGVFGVALISGAGTIREASPMFPIAILACVLATAFYGISGVYLKKFLQGAPTIAIAGCSQAFAGLALLPIVALSSGLPNAWPTGHALNLLAVNILGLALLCSSIAYVLYYRLVADVGPIRAMTVTYLIPVFGVIWAMIFLGEPLTWPMLAGGVLILGATLLVTSPARHTDTPAATGNQR